MTRRRELVETEKAPERRVGPGTGSPRIRARADAVPRRIRACSVLAGLLVAVPALAQDLRVLGEEHPRAFFFRVAEATAELIVGLSRCGASIREEKITVLPRETGESMYDLHAGLLYPAKTFVCLLGELVFYRRLKSEFVPDGEDEARPVSGSQHMPEGEQG